MATKTISLNDLQGTTETSWSTIVFEGAESEPVEIRVAPPDAMLMADIAALGTAGSVDDVSIVNKVIDGMLHPDDQQAFRDLSTQHRWTMETLGSVMGSMVEVALTEVSTDPTEA